MLTRHRYVSELGENISYAKETAIAGRKFNLTRKKCFATKKQGFFAQKREKRRMNGQSFTEN